MVRGGNSEGGMHVWVYLYLCGEGGQWGRGGGGWELARHLLLNFSH